MSSSYSYHRSSCDNESSDDEHTSASNYNSHSHMKIDCSSPKCISFSINVSSLLSWLDTDIDSHTDKHHTNNHHIHNSSHSSNTTSTTTSSSSLLCHRNEQIAFNVLRQYAASNRNEDERITMVRELRAIALSTSTSSSTRNSSPKQFSDLEERFRQQPLTQANTIIDKLSRFIIEHTVSMIEHGSPNISSAPLNLVMCAVTLLVDIGSVDEFLFIGSKKRHTLIYTIIKHLITMPEEMQLDYIRLLCVLSEKHYIEIRTLESGYDDSDKRDSSCRNENDVALDNLNEYLCNFIVDAHCGDSSSTDMGHAVQQIHLLANMLHYDEISRARIRKLPRIGSLYHLLMQNLTNNDMFVVLYSLIALIALVTKDTLETKMFSGSNLLQLLRLSFNLLFNVSSRSTCARAARFLYGLTDITNVMAALQSYPDARDTFRRIFFLLKEDDIRLHLPVLQLLSRLHKSPLLSPLMASVVLEQSCLYALLDVCDPKSNSNFTATCTIISYVCEMFCMTIQTTVTVTVSSSDLTSSTIIESQMLPIPLEHVALIAEALMKMIPLLPTLKRNYLQIVGDAVDALLLLSKYLSSDIRQRIACQLKASFDFENVSDSFVIRMLQLEASTSLRSELALLTNDSTPGATDIHKILSHSKSPLTCLCRALHQVNDNDESVKDAIQFVSFYAPSCAAAASIRHILTKALKIFNRYKKQEVENTLKHADDMASKCAEAEELNALYANDCKMLQNTIDDNKGQLQRLKQEQENERNQARVNIDEQRAISSRLVKESNQQIKAAIQRASQARERTEVVQSHLDELRLKFDESKKNTLSLRNQVNQRINEATSMAAKLEQEQNDNQKIRHQMHKLSKQVIALEHTLTKQRNHVEQIERASQKQVLSSESLYQQLIGVANAYETQEIELNQQMKHSEQLNTTIVSMRSDLDILTTTCERERLAHTSTCSALKTTKNQVDKTERALDESRNQVALLKVELTKARDKADKFAQVSRLVQKMSVAESSNSIE